jgi:hypothetical protein
VSSGVREAVLRRAFDMPIYLILFDASLWQATFGKFALDFSPSCTQFNSRTGQIERREVSHKLDSAESEI